MTELIPEEQVRARLHNEVTRLLTERGESTAIPPELNGKLEGKHTPECISSYARYLVDSYLYKKQYPGYCHHCGGQGLHYIQPSRDDPGDEYECPYCLEKEICPRCGHGQVQFATVTDDLKIEGSIKCLHCGWKPGDASLPDFECWCWEIDMEQFLNSEAKQEALDIEADIEAERRRNEDNEEEDDTYDYA